MGFFRKSGLFTVLAVISALVPAMAQTGQGSWSVAAQTTTERTEIAVTAYRGKIYVVGGEALGRLDSPLLQEFDPATGKWRDLAPMPLGASHLGVAVLDGKIYVAGGFTANVHKNPRDQFAAYDIATNQWRTLPSLSSPRGSVGMAAVDGKLHIIGGRGADGKTVSTHDIFDPKTGKWTTGAALPVARDHLGIVVVDGKIYIVGGRLGATVDNVGLADVYDPATDSWKSLPPMPTPRSSGAIAYYRGLILYHGGECKDRDKHLTFDAFEGYDIKANRWISLPKAPTGLHADGAAAVGNAAYFIGGSSGCGGTDPSKAVYAFKLTVSLNP